MKRPYATALCALMMLGASACSKTSNTPIVGKALNGLTGMHDEKEARLSTAANNAIAEGKTKEALDLYAKLYKVNESNPEVALNYAQLLRKTGKPQEAVDVLKDFVDFRRGFSRKDISPVILNEYAAGNIDLGKYNVAGAAIIKVLNDENAAPYHADAKNLLGLILDAQGKHQDAEHAYRMALQGWKGDNTSVMNNLGLCLAAQGRFDESLTILRQALLKAPQRTEIVRNIEMIDNLRKSVIPRPPIAVTPPPRSR